MSKLFAYVSRAYGDVYCTDADRVEYVVCETCAGILPDYAAVLGTHQCGRDTGCQLCGTTIDGSGTAVVSAIHSLTRYPGTTIPEGDAVAAAMVAMRIASGRLAGESMAVVDLPRTSGRGQTVVAATGSTMVLRDDDGTAISARMRAYPRR